MKWGNAPEGGVVQSASLYRAHRDILCGEHRTFVPLLNDCFFPPQRPLTELLCLPSCFR